jgi:heme/copper-type cytochrome/quinol oxidase subunit 1
MANTFLAASSMLIAMPTGMKIFHWLATLYGDSLGGKVVDMVPPSIVWPPVSLVISCFDRCCKGE